MATSKDPNDETVPLIPITPVSKATPMASTGGNPFMRTVTLKKQDSNNRRPPMGETIRTNVVAEVKSEENNSSIVQAGNKPDESQIEERD